MHFCVGELFHPWYTCIPRMGSPNIYGACTFCWKHTDSYFYTILIPHSSLCISVSTQMKGEKAKVRQLCFLTVESRLALQHISLIPINKLLALSACGGGLLTGDKSPAARMGPICRCHLSLVVYKVQDPHPPESPLVSFFNTETTKFMGVKVII